MKTTSSYRLSVEAKAKLLWLAQELGLNHTQVLELILEETQIVSKPKIEVIIKGDKNERQPIS